MLKNKCESQEHSEELARYHKKWSYEEKQTLAYVNNNLFSWFENMALILPTSNDFYHSRPGVKFKEDTKLRPLKNLSYIS